MQQLSMKSFLSGILSASFFWIVAIIPFVIEFEISSPNGWPTEIKIKENPVTQNRRVVDTTARTTVFWSSGNPLVVPIAVQKTDANHWNVTFEKPIDSGN